MLALSIRGDKADPAHQDCHEAYRAYRRAIMLQCLIPAPTPAQAKWKRRVMKGYTMPQDVSDAIMADDARFAT